MAVTVIPTPIAATMGTSLVVQLTMDGPDALARSGHNLQWVVSDPTRGAFVPVYTVVAPPVGGGVSLCVSTFTPAAVTAGPVHQVDIVDTDDMNTVLATVNVTVAAAPAAPVPGAPAPAAAPLAGAPAPAAAPAAVPAAAPVAAPAAGGMVFHAPVNGGVHVGAVGQQQTGRSVAVWAAAAAVWAAAAAVLILLLAILGMTGWAVFGKSAGPPDTVTGTPPAATSGVAIPRAQTLTLPDPIKVEVTIKDGDPPAASPPAAQVATARVVYVACPHAPNCD
jgi:hypothetical protein